MDATREIRRSATEIGLTIPPHEPTQLDDQNIFHADLVLIASQHHASWISRRLGVIPDHVWGIRQAAGLAKRAAPPEGETPADRLLAMSDALKAEHDREPEPLRSLDDPYGYDQATFDRVMAEIVEDIDVLTEWARLSPDAGRNES